jgi:endonuclease/exonuclease/phosphatase family metal-dependent hydrolase
MLRIVSYNIHSGKDMFWRNRLAEMADTLSALDADVITLQEVHQNSRLGFQASYLADVLRYSCAYGPSMSVADGGYGNAVLTRLPLLQYKNTPLSAKKEARSLLKTTLNWNDDKIAVWVTHYSLDRKSRQAQMQTISSEAEQHSETPLIVTGDFNTSRPVFPPTLRDCAKEKELHRLPTLIPFARRVDFVLVSAEWEVCDYQVVGVKWSDHFPVVATLRLVERPKAPAE